MQYYLSLALKLLQMRLDKQQYHSLSVGCNEKTLKILQLADDKTLFVRTVMSGNTAIKIIKN